MLYVSKITIDLPSTSNKKVVTIESNKGVIPKDNYLQFQELDNVIEIINNDLECKMPTCENRISTSVIPSLEDIKPKKMNTVNYLPKVNVFDKNKLPVNEKQKIFSSIKLELEYRRKKLSENNYESNGGDDSWSD